MNCLGVMCTVRGNCTHFHNVDVALPNALIAYLCPVNKKTGERTMYEPLHAPVIRIEPVTVERRVA